MVERHPMKNYLKPEEVAEMADFNFRKSKIHIRTSF
jgi:hypothetical protein